MRVRGIEEMELWLVIRTPILVPVTNPTLCSNERALAFVGLCSLDEHSTGYSSLDSYSSSVNTGISLFNDIRGCAAPRKNPRSGGLLATLLSKGEVGVERQGLLVAGRRDLYDASTQGFTASE